MPSKGRHTIGISAEKHQKPANFVIKRAPYYWYFGSEIPRFREISRKIFDLRAPWHRILKPGSLGTRSEAPEAPKTPISPDFSPNSTGDTQEGGWGVVPEGRKWAENGQKYDFSKLIQNRCPTARNRFLDVWGVSTTPQMPIPPLAYWSKPRVGGRICPKFHLEQGHSAPKVH